MFGFALSLTLTGVAFWVALGTNLSSGKIMAIIGVLGIVQLVAQLRYFLHIDTRKQKREDFDLILFSTLVLLIIVLGTVWIMGNLSIRMHMGM
ncbi:MAG: cytochrome C oxidase subunit IV family protein [Rhodobacteraceae bacterium]|nr:cytochrome C oxidase subunit IV family protein [Paracoccaceae bacterium]